MTDAPLTANAFFCETRGDQDLVALARAHGMGEDGAQALAAIDRVLARFRRGMMRRDFGRLLLAQLDAKLDVAHLDVISTIGHAHGAAEGEEITVGLISERLGIDPSRASRVAAEVVERGYARRIASQADARRICLQLTAKGEVLVAAVRRNKWNQFATALGQWDEAELVTFARLLERFSNWTSDVQTRDAPTGEAADLVKAE